MPRQCQGWSVGASDEQSENDPLRYRGNAHVLAFDLLDSGSRCERCEVLHSLQAAVTILRIDESIKLNPKNDPSQDPHAGHDH